MGTLCINELFWSLQGEGTLSGQPAFFIRLQGCPGACSFCDTRYAQKRDPKKKLAQSASSLFQKKKHDETYGEIACADLVAEIAARIPYKIAVIITGGEPFAQDIHELQDLLTKNHYPIHIETSGFYPVYGEHAWITLSPKRHGFVEANWERADEIKLVVRTEEDIVPYQPYIQAMPSKRILLQPIDQDKEATKLCVELCKKYNWRLSIQMHKYINIQ
ncbi:MAG: radical SAM protein [Desulfovibrio sp.]|nr:radical SAM protein [Desulfovibrio sp.]